MRGIFTSIALLLVLRAATPVLSQTIIAGYYPSWMRSTLRAEKVDFETLTHVIQAFAWPKSDGSIAMYADLLYPELVEAAHGANRKILVAFGGYGQSGGFARMAADSLARLKFIDNVVNFLWNHNYDGIDLDWEFPASTAEKKSLTSLVDELRRIFDKENPDWLITMATNPGPYFGQYFDYEALQGNMSWFAEMAYDFHGGWTNHAGHNAPLFHPPNDPEGSGDSGFRYLHETRGIPKEKLLFGMPFYGREFNAAALYGASTGGNVTHLFRNILPKINSGWTYHWDDFSKVPYLQNANQTRLITFDDTASVRIKTEYAINKDLAGVMIWALGQDVIGDSQPLLEAIGKTVRQTTDIAPLQGQVAGSFELFENYPNPFNPSTTIRFYLQKAMPVRLTVHDINGRLVAVLMNSTGDQGMNSAIWRASEVASGMYFYKIQAGDFVSAKKMLLLH